MLKNLTEIAAENNLKYQRLTVLRKKGLITPKEGKKYDPDEVVAAYRSFYSSDYDGGLALAKDVVMERQKAQARLYGAKAALLELELQKRRGELIEKSDMIKHFVARILNVKFSLQALAKLLPPLLYDKTEAEMENIIRDQVNKILQRFASPLPRHLGGVNIDFEKLESKLDEVVSTCLIANTSNGSQKSCQPGSPH